MGSLARGCCRLGGAFAVSQTAVMGRPTDYNTDRAATICSRIACGESLRKVCMEDEMPSATSVFLWLTKYPDFADNYANAQRERSEALYEEMFEIGDDVKADPAEVSKAKLRVDTRKWALARMNPKKYGDKIAHVGGGPDDSPIKTETILGVDPSQFSAEFLQELAAKKVT